MVLELRRRKKSQLKYFTGKGEKKSLSVILLLVDTKQLPSPLRQPLSLDCSVELRISSLSV